MFCHVLGVAVIHLYLIASVTSFCNRVGHVCYHGSCTPNGTCDCYPDFTGHDCSIPVDYTYRCINRCNDHGTCYNVFKCHCDIGYYGNNCELKNETMSCNIERMEMEITLNLNKIGRTVSLLKNENCVFDRTSLYSFSKTIPLVTSPGSECTGIIQDVQNDVVRYTALVQVRDRIDMIGPLDYVTNFTCMFPNRGNGHIRRPTADPKLFDVLLFDESDTPVIKSMDKQYKFMMAFYPVKQTYYKEIDIIELKMYDEETSNLIYDIILNGCPTVPGVDLLDGVPFLQSVTLPSGQQLEAKVVPFKPLERSWKLFFDYSVRFCNGRCIERQCAGQQIPRRRKGTRIELN